MRNRNGISLVALLIGILFTLLALRLAGLTVLRMMRVMRAESSILQAATDNRILLKEMEKWFMSRKDASEIMGPNGTNYFYQCGPPPNGLATLQIFRRAMNGAGATADENIIYTTKCVASTDASLSTIAYCAQSDCPTSCPAGQKPMIVVTHTLADPTNVLAGPPPTMALRPATSLEIPGEGAPLNGLVAGAFCYSKDTSMLNVRLEEVYHGENNQTVQLKRTERALSLTPYSPGNTQYIYQYP